MFGTLSNRKHACSTVCNKVTHDFGVESVMCVAMQPQIFHAALFHMALAQKLRFFAARLADTGHVWAKRFPCDSHSTRIRYSSCMNWPGDPRNRNRLTKVNARNYTHTDAQLGKQTTPKANKMDRLLF